MSPSTLRRQHTYCRHDRRRQADASITVTGSPRTVKLTILVSVTITATVAIGMLATACDVSPPEPTVLRSGQLYDPSAQAETTAQLVLKLKQNFGPAIIDDLSGRASRESVLELTQTAAWMCESCAPPSTKMPWETPVPRSTRTPPWSGAATQCTTQRRTTDSGESPKRDTEGPVGDPLGTPVSSAVARGCS